MINIKGRITNLLKGSIRGGILQKLRDKRCLNFSTRFKNKSSRYQRIKTRIGTKGVGQRQEPSTGLTKQFKLIGYLPWYRGQVAERSCVGLQIPSNRVQLPTYPHTAVKSQTGMQCVQLRYLAMSKLVTFRKSCLSLFALNQFLEFSDTQFQIACKFLVNLQ